MNEGITNLSRRKVEAKAEIKRRLLVDFNFAKGARRTGGWCEPHRQTVRAARAGGKKVSEKPPNPRRGTSLKEKLVKAISLKNKTYSKIERS